MAHVVQYIVASSCLILYKLRYLSLLYLKSLIVSSMSELKYLMHLKSLSPLRWTWKLKVRLFIDSN